MSGGGHGNLDPKKRLDRAEEILAVLLESNQMALQRFEEHDRQMSILRDSQLATNESVKSLVTAIRDLIDRIPPDNLTR